MLKRVFPHLSSKRGNLNQHTRSRVTHITNYNKHIHTYRTRTHKQTRGVKAGSFASRKLILKSFCIWNSFSGLHPLLFWRGRGNRSTQVSEQKTKWHLYTNKCQ